MISVLIVLIKMLAAHLLGDFIFQSDNMCRKKLSSKQCDKLAALALHSLIQGGLTYILIAQWGNWFIPIVIVFSHFFIDWIKSISKERGLKSFLIDQAFHIIIIILLWWLYYIKLGNSVEIPHNIFSFNAWVILTSFIAIISPSSLLIKLFLEFNKWSPNTNYYRGLPNAGKWIGYFERILILIFIFTDNIEGVGFLLAAKSIFRFGELNKAKDLKVTEYVLIGTLISFLIAISIAYTALYIINKV